MATSGTEYRDSGAKANNPDGTPRHSVFLPHYVRLGLLDRYDLKLSSRPKRRSCRIQI
jgi:hypothetical protein